MEGYTRAAWFAFRAEVIKLDGGLCVRCGRGEPDVVLQVHHKRYLPGRKPWEYPHDMCETLCRGCHGREHGKVRPNVGWECTGYTDLEDLSGTCDLCGTAIRHVFLVQHRNWEPMEVGEVCCDNLTCTTLATNHMESVRRFSERRKRFVSSSRWSRTPGGLTIKQNKIELVIRRDGERYRLQMNGLVGKLTFSTLLDAQMKAFDVIESGKAGAFLREHGRSSRRR